MPTASSRFYWNAAMRAVSDRAGGVFLAAALTVFAMPTLLRLAREEWSSEQGAQGPIILTTGLWLLWSEWRQLSPRAPNPAILWGAMGVALVAYVPARVVGILWIEWLAVYGTLVTVLYGYCGAAIKRLWFPIAYLLFLVPPPYLVASQAMHARKLWLATSAVDLLDWLGFQVARLGNTLYIDQYEMRVVNACAGFGSLVSLMATGLFYTYVRHRSDWRYAVLLTLLIFPVAMFANLVRVVIVLLGTHYAGLAFVDGILHEAVGIMMFVVAITCLVAMDGALRPLRLRLATK